MNWNRYNQIIMTKKIPPIENLILDMDGVLWHADTPVPGLSDFFSTMQKNRLKFVLATNNATKTSDQYASKLARFGVNVGADKIVTSSETTALFLRQQYPERSTVYVIGEEGLYHALLEAGLRIINNELPENVFSQRADFVVVGMTRHVCYSDLTVGSILINHGAQFIGTNPDVTFPTEDGMVPGAGSLLAFIEAATGKKPIVIGKPNAALFEEALKRLGSRPEETYMVGDRLNTDIHGAQKVGIRTILLLSGITQLADLDISDVKPDFIFSSLSDLTSYITTESSQIHMR